MEKIVIFDNIQHAINILEKYSYSYFESKYKFPVQMDKDDIIRNSVTKNIFRAFHNLDPPPSSIYRSWATQNYDSIVSSLNTCATQDDFDDHVFKWTDDFIDHWHRSVDNSQKRILYGPAIKIVNLFIKTISESSALSNKSVIKFMHIPFDEYSLKPVRNIINDLTDVKFRIEIPKSPTMKLITTHELYNIFRRALSNLARQANIYPICYDYWCWNERH